MTPEQICRLAPVIPVLTIEDIATAVPLAKALTAGGLRVLEVTMRTPIALQAMAEIAASVPDAIVGAGTLITPDDVDAALAAGARFGVSPGATDEMLDACTAAGLAMLPGVATPSEAMRALTRGFDVLKFFPAEPNGGVPALKALAAPLPQLRFCPTGGIGPANVDAYLALPNVLCVGGSWVAPVDAVRGGDWPRIEALAQAAANLSSSS